MKDAVNERLKAVRTALKLLQREFAKGIYLQQGSYSRLEEGLVKTNERIIELVCTKYKVNKDWLKTGKGAMFSESPPDAKLERLNQIFNEMNGSFQDFLLIQAKELLNFQHTQEQPVRPGKKSD